MIMTGFITACNGPAPCTFKYAYTWRVFGADMHRRIKYDNQFEFYSIISIKYRPILANNTKKSSMTATYSIYG